MRERMTWHCIFPRKKGGEGRTPPKCGAHVTNIALETVHEKYRTPTAKYVTEYNDRIVMLPIPETLGVASRHISRFGWRPNAAGG
jgi:hypothetical protein